MIECLVCLEETAREGGYHARCLERLFGAARCPKVDLGNVSVSEAIATQSDRISISGVQDKLIVDLTDDGGTIVPSEDGRYILKVPVSAYKHLPENEHLTMILATAAGLAVPACGLVRLPDGDAAYIVKRFDRGEDHSKRRQEDFCSLLQRDPTKKYESSAEECLSIVQKYSSDAGGDSHRLFLQFLFAFWVGNDDLHLKNLSLAEASGDGLKLSMAYDLVCTRLYPQLNKGMALPLSGRKIHHQRKNFIAFAERCDIDENEAAAAIDRLRAEYPRAKAIIERSALPSAFKATYRKELEKKTRALGGPRA